MARSYDVVVLGAGNAGIAAATTVRASGRSVAVVEAREPGGTCPLRGCVPKKVLVAAAEAMHEIDVAAVHHIAVQPPRLDWPALIARERSFVDGKAEMFADLLAGRGIDLIEGRARFVARTTVEVGGERLEADKVVIATGSTPRPLPIAGSERLITSDDILTMARLPQSLIFVGGGVIAMEFSHVLARAGCKVTILEVAGRILPGFEADVVARLADYTRGLGIDILTDVAVEEIVASGGASEVRFGHQGRPQRLTAERVANGAGRVPDVEPLEPGAAGIALDGRRIAVDVHLRSVSNPDVYVVGDAHSGWAQLSPLATYEGRLAGASIVDGVPREPDYASVPAAVFTVPALATVGLTESAAAERGLDVEAKATDMGDFFATRNHGEPVAFAKVLVERGSQRILGAHMLGHRAEELIHLFAFAIRHGVTAEDLRTSVYVFPTFSSDVASLV